MIDYEFVNGNPADSQRHIVEVQANRQDSAARQILFQLRDNAYSAIFCYNNGKIAGMITYSPICEEEGFQFTFIRNFGVLPSHTRKGIGRELLERVKSVANETTGLIFACGVNSDAYTPLEQAKFEKVGVVKAGEEFEDRMYKWSELPEHKNNYHPSLNRMWTQC